ncbi:MAG: squalene/phytoene synthase family protein, partial [Myxococcaceae bacterium]
LAATSRNFALDIPFLPEPVRCEVTIADLLWRIGDTLEDAPWPAPRRVEALGAFGRLLGAPRDVPGFLARVGAGPGDASPACLDLLARAGTVLAAFDALSAPAREVVKGHVLKTLEGMAEIAGASSGWLELQSLGALRRYCYVVAGLVGELLTELFLLHHPPLSTVAESLRDGAAAFGEGLQLTNILKDEAEDEAAGRRFVPPSIPHAEVFSLARRDLTEAVAYVQALRQAGAPRGFLEFTGLPVRLAIETLQAVEQRGAGAKVPREQVAQIVASLAEALDNHGPLFPAAA